MARFRGSKGGFTLLELLVVILIIGILAALIFPTLRSARSKSYSSVCLNNLRQISMATLAYCQDNNDFLPYAWINDSDAEWNNFHGLLQPFINRTPFDGFRDFEKHIFRCPQRALEPVDDAGGNPFRVSYGMNAFNAVSYPDRLTKRLGTVNDISRTVLATDVFYTYNHPAVAAPTIDQMGYKHLGRVNVLFADGHGQGYLAAEMVQFAMNF